ncbi:macrophage-capping protein isoform X2 [Xenopus laevis]|uniref:Macrophage-capping protein isoform X2 n=1 Tax=Xenopus laevis TaxID=8355 RepID=A0A8J1L633_XENLA|nr:macrophage-capping protein isoform X2 [Xenopus laevis]
MGKKETMPASYSVKTRLGSSRRATDPNIEVTVERTTKGMVSCSIKGKKKKRKSCSRSGMESDSDSVELEAGVGVTAGSCGATTEASQEERVESDGCKMAADSEEPRSSVALEVAESALTNQEMATDNMEPECSMALEVAESALGDLEMAAASEEHGNRDALDTEQSIYIWSGSKSNMLERNRARDLAYQIRDSERSGAAKVEIIQEGEEPEEMIKILGKRPESLRDANVEDDKEADERHTKGATLYKVSNASGQMQVTCVGDGALLRKEQLISDDCFILDCVGKIYVWKGRKANKEEQESSLKTANEFLSLMSYSPTTQVQVVSEGNESPLFRQFFSNWM